MNDVTCSLADNVKGFFQRVVKAKFLLLTPMLSSKNGTVLFQRTGQDKLFSSV